MLKKSDSPVRRWPVSIPNTVLLGAFLGGALVLLVLGRIGEGIWLGAIDLVALGCALYARRPDSRDITRINAIEYRDERDKSLAAEGFSVVGAAALILGVVSFLVMMLLDEFSWYITLQLLALAIVWSIANSLAVRRR